MMADDVCDCGRIIVQPEIGRRRRKCLICNPRDTRDRTGRYHAKVSELPVRSPDEPGSVTIASRKALDEAGQLSTWKGAAALALAEIIDAGRHGASGPGGTVKAHREAMGFALADAPEDHEGDVIWAIFNTPD
jgi:hypothetical protein